MHKLWPTFVHVHIVIATEVLELKFLRLSILEQQACVFMLKGLVGDIKLTQYFHLSEMIKKRTCIPDQSSSLNSLMSNNGEILIHDGVYIYTY